MIDFDMVKANLLSKGVRLRPPASKGQIETLTSELGSEAAKEIVSMYQSFDGFEQGDFDAKTFISMWPIGKVLANVSKTKLPYIVIADVAFEAQHLEVDYLNAKSAIRDADSGRDVYSDFKDLLSVVSLVDK